MYQFPIGAMVDSFRMPSYEAVKAAADIGVKGLQMYATSGDNAPDVLVGKKRRTSAICKRPGACVFCNLRRFGKGLS